MKKIIFIVIVVLFLGVVGYFTILNPWYFYDRQQLAEAGYPPQQSPQVNTDLALSQVEGEIYFDTHNGDYTGVCNSSKMVELRNHMIGLGKLTVTCQDTKTGWATLVTLEGNNERYWCRDSQGNRAGWDKRPADFNITTSCPIYSQ